VAVVQYTYTHTNNTENVTKQSIYRTTQKYIEHKKYIQQHKNWEECGPCPVFAGFTLAFALHPRIKHGKTSVRVAIHNHTMRNPRNSTTHPSLTL